MRHLSWPRAACSAFALAGLLGLSSCGGGGDDGGGGPGGGGPGGGTGTHSGRVWRSEYSTSAGATLSETVASDGTARQVGRGEAVPWPDGSRFATRAWNTTDTEVLVLNTGSGAQLRAVEFDGLVQDLKPSPVNGDVLAARQGTSTLGPFDWVIADLSQLTIVDRFQASGAGFGWLPDGRFVTVSSAGEIRRGSVGQGASAAVIGQLSLPAGRSVANAWVNRQGTALAVRLDLRPATGQSESDLWIANLDGSGFARYTATRMTTFAAWSPDGQRIAFDVDTGAWCTGSSCQGICEVWHAGVDARNILATTNSGDAQAFTRLSNGSGQRLGCSLRGWTP